MGPFAAGQIVLIPFPFTDLSGSKVRPALLLASVGRADWIACQITSNPHADPRAIPLSGSDFSVGGLQRLSFICPGKLFTANESLVAGSPGRVERQILERVRDTVLAIIRGTIH
jgi:mRNA interferase MazF